MGVQWRKNSLLSGNFQKDELVNPIPTPVYPLIFYLLVPRFLFLPFQFPILSDSICRAFYLAAPVSDSNFTCFTLPLYFLFVSCQYYRTFSLFHTLWSFRHLVLFFFLLFILFFYSLDLPLFNNGLHFFLLKSSYPYSPFCTTLL